MDTVQGVGAVISLAELALKAAQLVRRVFRAQAQAKALSCSAQEAGNLAQAIKEVIGNRKSSIDNASRSPVEDAILQVIERSLQGCHHRLSSMVATLKPLTEAQFNDIPHEIKVGVKFVRAEDFLKEQQSRLDRHFRDLTLSFSVLNSFDLHVLRRDNVRSDLTFNRSTLDSVTFVGVDGHESARPNADSPPRQSTVKVTGEITSKDPQGWNLLHYAANSLDLRTIQRLLRSPQAQEPDFLNSVTPGDETALILAAKHANSEKAVEVAQALMEKGCRLDLTDSSSVGRSALYHAVDGPAQDDKRVDFAFALVNGGARVDQLLQDHPRKYEKLQQFQESHRWKQLSQQRRRNTTSNTVNTDRELESAMGKERRNSMPALATSQRPRRREGSFSSWFSSKSETIARIISNST